jgi:hypothetical protein
VVDAALLFKYARQNIETAEIKVNADEGEELSITL